MHTIRCGQGHRHEGATPTAAKLAVFQCARASANQAHSVRADVPARVNPNTVWNFKTPREMVEGIRDGWYAVTTGRSDAETSDHIFIRVSHPQTKKLKGQHLLQTQHSGGYKPLITFYPGGSLYISQRGDRLDIALMLVAADPFTTSQKYAQIHKRCGRCNKKLTDKRSRWYGIGPECEKHWPEDIDEVNETKGVFVPTY